MTVILGGLELELTLSVALQVAATATTLGCTYMAANRSLLAPVLGIVSNVFWFALEIHLSLWLLVPVPVVMTALHVRVYRRWSRA